MIILEDFLKTLSGADMMMIKKGEKVLFKGYLALMDLEKEKPQYIRDKVEKFRAVPDIKHKNWEKLGLMKPLMPEETPQYSFSDLQMTLYYTIILKDENKERIEELQRIIMEHEECCKGCPDSGHQEACECCDVYGNMMDFQRELQGLQE